MQGSVRQRGQQSRELRVHAGCGALTGRKRYVQRTVRGTKRDARAALARLVTGACSTGRQIRRAGASEGEWRDSGDRLRVGAPYV